MTDFDNALARLKDDLLTQAQRVREVFSRSIESFFTTNLKEADAVIDADRVIDKVDVEIERASIPLLAMGVTDEYHIRSVLTIVKVNNELERIADCAVSIAEITKVSENVEMKIPQTFRVMANSVIGIVRDTNGSLRDTDIERAKRVLAFEHTVEEFKREILIDAQKKVASGEFSVEFAFRLHGVVKAIERVADHCTNICEQVIYLESGRVVRHLPGGWSEPTSPEEA